MTTIYFDNASIHAWVAQNLGYDPDRITVYKNTGSVGPWIQVSYVPRPAITVDGGCEMKLTKTQKHRRITMTAHKHAALIMEYAKLAQEHERPWEFFEYRYNDGHPNNEVSAWMSIGMSPLDMDNVEVRLKQRTITLPDGTVLPEPVREAPEFTNVYYLPWPRSTSNDTYKMWWRSWNNDEYDEIYLSSGLIHLTEANARAWWNYFVRLAKKL